MNHLIVSGNLGQDPELQVTANGTPFTRLSVAVREWNGATQKEETLWLRVTTWNSLAERVDKFLHKGMKVLCYGKLSVRAYTDKEGISRTAVEMVAFQVDWDMKAVPRGAEREDYAARESLGDDGGYGSFNPVEEVANA